MPLAALERARGKPEIWRARRSGRERGPRRDERVLDDSRVQLPRRARDQHRARAREHGGESDDPAGRSERCRQRAREPRHEGRSRVTKPRIEINSIQSSPRCRARFTRGPKQTSAKRSDAKHRARPSRLIPRRQPRESRGTSLATTSERESRTQTRRPDTTEANRASRKTTSRWRSAVAVHAPSSTRVCRSRAMHAERGTTLTRSGSAQTCAG